MRLRNLGLPDLLFVAGQVNDVKAINDQIAELPNQEPHTACASFEGLKEMDRWHFNSAGITTSSLS